MTDRSAGAPARLFTAFGTVLYVDVASGALLHGPVKSSPANAFLVPADSPEISCRRALLKMVIDGSPKPIVGRADGWLSVVPLSETQPIEPLLLDVIPLERGLLALRRGQVFLKAMPDGQIRLSASVCSTWELFIASEDWCTDPDTASGDVNWRAIGAAFDTRRIKSYIVHPSIRARATAKSRHSKLLIFGYTKWSHGRVYYDLCKHLHRRGYIVDILDWQINHSEYIHELVPAYDLFMTALDGVDTLVDTYGIPYEKIIAVSHHEFDIRMLIERKGPDVFDRFANYGVVGESVYCASLIRGISRIPMVASLAVEYSEFEAEIAERLTRVGYASSMSVKTFGIEWKRGELAEAATREAGLDFKVAGWTGDQVSFHEMPDFYRSVDAIVVSSISESGSLPVLEAAAAGRLVIGTPVGHFPSKAYHGGGILAPIEQSKFVEFTAATLRYYKENPTAYVEKCASIQSAARKFDWEYTIGEWIELIEGAQSSRARKTQIQEQTASDTSPKVLRKGIICDINWLSSYLADEHCYLIRLLNETYGFDIIDSKSTDFSDETTLGRLNLYSVLIIAYQGRVNLPLDLIHAYKILRVDDLVSYDAKYDKILNSLISSSNTVISPYAYEFNRHFKHDSVLWVPYSSALEGCKDHEKIVFNNNPICKILVSGSVAQDRPLRQYAASLKGDKIDVLDHPGYWNKYGDNSQAIVRTKYYQELSRYLACFSDGHAYRYIHLKNFEIASVGSLLLTDRIIEKEMNELGFVDGQTCIFCDKKDLLEKISWILDDANRSAVDGIRMAGMKLTTARHMTKHRASQIEQLVNSLHLETKQ